MTRTSEPCRSPCLLSNLKKRNAPSNADRLRTAHLLQRRHAGGFRQAEELVDDKEAGEGHKAVATGGGLYAEGQGKGGRHGTVKDGAAAGSTRQRKPPGCCARARGRGWWAACGQPSRLVTWRTCGVPSAQGGAEQGASAATTSAASCLQAPKLGLWGDAPNTMMEGQ